MKIFKGIQVVLLGVILITCSGCNLLNWGDSDNTSDGAQISDSVVVPDGGFVDEDVNSNPVPEPLTLLLLGPALLGLFAINKKKKQG